MEDNQIPWTKIYVGLMASLLVMIGLLYWLTLAYS